MLLNFKNIFGSFLLTIMGISCHVEYSIEKIDIDTQDVIVKFSLSKERNLYKDSVDFSIDSPEFKLSDWSTQQVAVENINNKEFKGTHKAIYNQNMQAKIRVTRNSESDAQEANIHLNYLINGKPKWQEKTIPVKFESKKTTNQINSINNNNLAISYRTQEKENKYNLKEDNTPAGPLALVKLLFNNLMESITLFFTNIKDYIWATLENSDSVWFRILLAFLLGLMMSLTPCIYPMIPVTIGILQQNASKSFLANMLTAICYTLGIGLTFALLGLIASLGGMAFGQILGNPFFVIALVAFLGYLAFSMFGFYEMYIPRFLQPKDSKIKHGSYLSAFLFGAASGTIASPCLSPGLALILSIVASMANKIMGFIMLFAFGVGSSFPLLIIATFSTSINLLPQAGMWMVEVKKIFGFLLIAMCFYYLQAIVAWWILLWIISLFILLSGIYYITHIKSYESKKSKRNKTIIGIILISISFIFLIQSYKETFLKAEKSEISWLTDYQSAKEKALTENKNIFIDFGAKWCSICKAIENTILVKPEIQKLLDNNFVLLKVDGTNSASEPYASLHKLYNITGFPTLLIIDPQDSAVLKKWMGEFYDMPTEQIVKELEQFS